MKKENSTMKKQQLKRNLILGILFFLPVMFLLMLYPSTHNYDPLEIVNENVIDLNGFSSDSDEQVLLKDHITVLGFLGEDPLDKAIAMSNLKELVYDKFKGFKKFQVVIITPEGTQKDIEALKREINSYEDLRFWHYSFGSKEQIYKLYNSLKFQDVLGADLSSEHVFIIDKDLSQRGRLDDREDKEKQNKKPVYGLVSYDCIEVAEIKNKMSDDMRILFTEYRQKRKGKFDSSSRRADDLKTDS